VAAEVEVRIIGAAGRRSNRSAKKRSVRVDCAL